MDQNKDSQVRKYLVRELKVMKGENCMVFSLHYVDIDGEEISYRPFDRERAGYIYIETLSLIENGQGRLQLVY